jgi:hypothetical protein
MNMKKVIAASAIALSGAGLLAAFNASTASAAPDTANISQSAAGRCPPGTHPFAQSLGSGRGARIICLPNPKQ